MNGDTFLEFVHGTLIPEMEPFDGSIRKSIMILDTVFLRNLAAWNRAVRFKVHGMQAHAHDLHYRNGRVRRREAGEWTSRRPRNFAAGCSDLKLNLAMAGNTVIAQCTTQLMLNRHLMMLEF